MAATQSFTPCALITGAGQGIGRGIALALAADGYDIVANDIVADPTNTAKGLYEVKARVEAFGRRCLPVQADISKPADQQKLVDAAVAEFGGIDMLVNNAGVAPKVRTDILETTEESYDRLMTINLRGPFFLTQKVARQMLKQQGSGAGGQGSGSAASSPAPSPRTPTPVIVFISSISAYVSSTGRPEYCISKAGVSMSAMLYADRLARDGICVYEIRPGIIATDMTAVVKEKYDKMIADGLLPQPRWGTPEDIGKAVVGLAKGYLAYSTGQVIEVGGGFGIRRL
ncbi:MAG: 3-ketoacyl-ACP reductase [Phycisphaerae bacterium]|nr:3-ketoacyl-ACP reductase [Phycisphaerae bacterium]